MSYEYSTRAGVLRLFKAGCRWALEFNRCGRGQWTSPNDAALTIGRQATGLEGWARMRLCVSNDVQRWRPVCTNF
jgi:hypothetical protein